VAPVAPVAPIGPAGPAWFQLIATSFNSRFEVDVSQLSLKGAGSFDGSRRMTPVETFSHPLYVTAELVDEVDAAEEPPAIPTKAATRTRAVTERDGMFGFLPGLATQMTPGFSIPQAPCGFPAVRYLKAAIPIR
jgi:hypothetical protein